MPKAITTAGPGEINTVGIHPKFEHVGWINQKTSVEKEVDIQFKI